MLMCLDTVQQLGQRCFLLENGFYYFRNCFKPWESTFLIVALYTLEKVSGFLLLVKAGVFLTFGISHIIILKETSTQHTLFTVDSFTDITELTRALHSYNFITPAKKEEILKIILVKESLCSKQNIHVISFNTLNLSKDVNRNSGNYV